MRTGTVCGVLLLLLAAVATGQGGDSPHEKNIKETLKALDQMSIVLAKVKDETSAEAVGSSRVDLQACKLEYSIVSPK